MSAESALKNLKKEFRETFKKVLKDSCEQLEAGQNRACSLLYEYLAQLVNPGKMNNLKSNPRFDLGMFYEQQELAFNLS